MDMRRLLYCWIPQDSSVQKSDFSSSVLYAFSCISYSYSLAKPPVHILSICQCNFNLHLEHSSKMRFQGVVPILLILAVICISTASGRKSGRDRKTTTSTTETSLENNGDNKEIHEGLSAELLGLKEQARNLTTETSTRRPREKKQKHRRKNKHHRGSHRQKKNRTRPTDILRAEDDKVPNQRLHGNGNPEAFTDSRDNEKLPIPRNHRKGKNNKNGRNRGTRHLGVSSANGEVVHRRFTNGHHGGNQNHNHKDSETSAKEHRRRRNHRKKKHNKPFTPSLEMANTHEPK